MSHSVDWYIKRARKLEEQGFADEAIAGLREAIQVHPDDGYVHAALGAALWDAGKREESIEAWRESTRLDSDLECPRLILSHHLTSLGRPQEALTVLRDGLDACPRSEALWLQEMRRVWSDTGSSHTPSARPSGARRAAKAEPHAQTVLEEVRQAVEAGRYAEALEKHVWFHDNALRLCPGLYGVRLSFALGYWGQLGAVYPPALNKLRAIRDDCAADLRAGQGERQTFHDLAAINRALDEDSGTVELFAWLDQNAPNVAATVFETAEPALTKAREHRLRARYTDPDASFRRLVKTYRQTMEMACRPEFGDAVREAGRRAFAKDTAMLVTLLALGDRKEDAARIAALAIRRWDDKGFARQLARAMNQRPA